jgi:hypothetical protein
MTGCQRLESGKDSRDSFSTKVTPKEAGHEKSQSQKNRWHPCEVPESLGIPQIFHLPIQSSFLGLVQVVLAIVEGKLASLVALTRHTSLALAANLTAVPAA